MGVFDSPSRGANRQSKKSRKKAAPRKKKAAPPQPIVSPGYAIVSKKPAFLAAFRATASVVKAAKSVRIARSRHYQWLADDSAYAAAFDKARQEAVQTLEDEAVRRAHEGTLEPVFYEGEQVDQVLKYSDSLLMFLLKGWKPDRYRERLEHSGPDGGPIVVDQRTAQLAELLTPDELQSIRTRFAAHAR